MRALLVYPRHLPQTYWSFSGALPYIERRAALPPLGLATVAALLPQHWELRLIDMNVAPLRDADLLGCDVVLASAMIAQAASLDELVARCKRLGVPVVAGGPYPSSAPDRLARVDHVFVGEAEGALGELAGDLERGRARPLYRADALPDLDACPLPRFDLLDLEAYASMALQHSRGCPFACEFCDIWKLYGRRPRVKSPQRIAAELDALLAAGWRGSLFFVDDNFIGNRRLARRSLAAIERWQREHGFPFDLYTEVSINLGRDEDLLRRMRAAGFSFVFVGIESPSAESLAGANKRVNAGLDLLACVRRIQREGIEVSGGFIVGFDEDDEGIFERQLAFIREAGIPMAMVGILTALEGTDLHERLRREGRLLGASEGTNTHRFEANFVTRMPPARLAEGYQRVMRSLYDPALRDYFARCRRMLEHLGPRTAYRRPLQGRDLRALARSLGAVLTRRCGVGYLRFLAWCLRRHPTRLADAVRLAIQGLHFELITREALACEAIRSDSRRVVERIRERAAQLGERTRRRGGLQMERLHALIEERARSLRRLRRRIRRLSPEARALAARAYADALAERFPRASRALANGRNHLDQLRRSLDSDIDRLRARCVQLGRRTSARLEELEPELRALARLRREVLRRARRAVRRLPPEVRLFGRLELRRLRQRLDELFPRPEAISARG